MKMEVENKKKRLVLVPCPYQGHINPMLQLATFLHTKGFSIAIVHTHFNSLDPSSHPEFTFFPIPDGLMPEESSSRNHIRILMAINANCKVTFEQELVRLSEHEPENKIGCIIYDEFMYFCEYVANRRSIPSIVLRTQNATNFIARSSIPQLVSQGYIPFPESMSLNMVPDLHPLRFKDMPDCSVATLENYLKLALIAHKVGASSAVIWNTSDCLEESSLAKVRQQYCEVPVFAIGPLHKINPTAAASRSLQEEDRRCIPWLDKQPPKSVIYVSLGSIACMSGKELAQMSWGLANSNQPFLWVIRPRSISGSDWIELLPQGFLEAVGERCCIVKWAPQREVLAHGAVGGFLSHCGWNSTMESMSEGVPILCRPAFSDQKVNARYISHVWRIGLHMENELERGEIEKAVKNLMVGEDAKLMRARAKELKEKILASINGGSCYNSLNELVDLIMSFYL